MNDKIQNAVQDMITKFNGSYDIARKISTPDPSNSFTGLGSAAFSHKSDNIILYQEEVTLYDSMDKEISNMKKSYFYQYDTGTHKIQKLFADGNLFHELILKEGSFYGEHLCNLDLYTARYSLNNDHLSVTYNVLGPKKNYVISTIYSEPICCCK